MTITRTMIANGIVRLGLGFPASQLRWVLTATSLGALIWAGAGCGGEAESEAKVLARVGDRVITDRDLLAEAALESRLGRAVSDPEELLRDLARREAMLQRVHDSGIDQDPAVRREMANLLIGKLLERELTPRIEAVSVTPEEIQAEYERNLGQYTRPAQVRLAILHLPANSKMSDRRREETRGRMKEARAKALQMPGEPRRRGATGFGRLAIGYSDDQVSRYRGGDIGWINEGVETGRWPESIIAAGFALERGEVSDVLEEDEGFFLVKKTDGRERSVRSLESVQSTLRQSLLAQKRKKIEATFRAEAEELASAEFNLELLNTVDLPDGKTALASLDTFSPPVLPDDNSTQNGN